MRLFFQMIIFLTNQYILCYNSSINTFTLKRNEHISLIYISQIIKDIFFFFAINTLKRNHTFLIIIKKILFFISYIKNGEVVSYFFLGKSYFFYFSL